MQYIPIPSTAAGEVALPDHDGLLVEVAEPSATPFDPDGITVTAGMVSGSLLASLGLGNLVIQGSYLYYLLDFAAVEHFASTGNGPALYTVSGVGLRIGFRSTQVSGKASFSLGGLAASATLEGTKTSFEATTVGVGLTMASLPFVQALIAGSMSSFNVTTLQPLGSAFGQLATYLSEERATITPKPIGVVLEAPAQHQSVATSYGYALRAIEGGSSYLEAMGKGVHSLPTGVQRLDSVMAATYSSVLKTTETMTRPNTEQRQRAGQVDNCGP